MRGEIQHILECSELKMIISSSLDNKIHITLDNAIGENQLLRVIYLKEDNILELAVYEEF